MKAPRFRRTILLVVLLGSGWAVWQLLAEPGGATQFTAPDRCLTHVSATDPRRDISPDGIECSSLRIVDSCAIALTPHMGTDRADREIIRLQEALGQAVEPVSYLERLGWAFIAKARVSYDPGFYKLAEQCALCIDSKRPGSAEALLLRGHVLHSLHQFQQAEIVARELVAQRGLWFDYGVLGDVLMEQGKLDEAAGAYQTMMNQRPGPQAYSRAAHLRWLTGDLPGAIALMQMAARANAARDPESGAWMHVRLALYHLQLGHSDVAEAHATAALQLQKDYAPALLAHGRILLAEGKSVEAIEPLQRAATLNPLPEYQWVLIEALHSAGRNDEAQAIKAQLRERGAANDARTFALYLATQGEDIETALRLSEAELIARADVFTHDARAWSLAAAGNVQQAHEHMQQALAHGTLDARLFYHAAVIEMRRGHDEEAQQWLEKAAAMQQTLLPSEREHLATLREHAST